MTSLTLPDFVAAMPPLLQGAEFLPCLQARELLFTLLAMDPYHLTIIYIACIYFIFLARGRGRGKECRPHAASAVPPQRQQGIGLFLSLLGSGLFFSHFREWWSRSLH